MDYNQPIQPPPTQQQFNHLVEIKDNLLRMNAKLVIGNISGNAISGLIGSLILLVPLGILANMKIGLGWPVIIAVWLIFLASYLADVIIASPISKNEIDNAPIPELRLRLLKYTQRDKIASAIFIPLYLVIFVWLANAMRKAVYLFVDDLGGFRPGAANSASELAFWIIMGIGIIFIIGIIVKTFISTPRTINQMVQIIDYANGNSSTMPNMN
jgi:hypothetical protein